MKKRVLSMLMTLALCLTMLPTAVFADVTENGEGSGGTHYVAESGGTQYEKVQEILDNEEGEITLLDSVTEDLAVYAPTTIHMNGHSITGNIDATDSLTLNGGTVDGTVTVDATGGTFTMTAPAEAEAAITGGLKVVSGSAFVSGAQVGVKGTLYFDGTDMLISGAVKAVELGSAAEPAAKTLYGSATVNGDTAAEAGFDTDTYKVGGEIAKKLTNKQVGSTTPAAPSLTLTETSKSLTAGKTAVFTANYTGTDTLNAYVQGSAVNGYFTISQKNNGDGTYTVSVKIDEETPGGTYTLFVHELGNTSVQASATITVTGLPDAAEVNGKQYKSLPRALNAARDGDTVKLLADHVTDADALNALGENFTFEQYASIVPVVTKTLTLDLNHKTVDYLEVGFTETNEETQKKETLETGNLTVTGEGAYGRISNLMFMAGALDIQSGEIGGSGCAGLFCDANSGSVTVSNGTVYGLTVFEGASVTVNGGSKHAGEWVVASGATLNITDGTFGDVQFTRNGTIAISGGMFQSIKSYIAEELQPLMSLLDTQKVHAFYKGDDVQDGNATELADVTVKKHTHTMVNNKCACGFSCTHTNTEGASTIDKDGKCTVCGTQFAAGIGETYYTDVPSALDAATDGQTVKLLANTMLPDGIYVSKTLTLDLDGHSLSGYSLNVGGLTATGQVRTGKLTVIDSSGGNGAVGVIVRDGGTLVFDPENDHTTLLRLEVWGGTVKLYGGKISRSGLQLHKGITLGNLLPQKAGLAYYCGDTQLTLKEAASKTCDLVVKSCSHGGKNGFDGSFATCPYCGVAAVAETALNHGEGSRLQRRFADLQTALDADRDGGAILYLLADVTGDYTIDGTQDTGLNLNGHSIKGTVTVKAAAGNNTTTLSNTKNITTASIDAVVAHRGAKLAGSKYPAVIGVLTLADTTQWEDILQQPTRLGFRVTNADGTHQWYAPNDVKDSQLNNVIINSLPITTKTLNLKVDGKNLTGNKVERGTTVQLCASCNAKGADVYIYTGEIDGNNVPTYSQKKAEYKKIGSNWYYVVDLDANTIGTYDIYFTATKDGYSVTSSHKKLTVTKATIPASVITAPAANALTYNGNEQVLVKAGSVGAEYGEMQYRLGTSGSFSTAIPTATDAGTYTVYYKVVGAEGYNDTTAKSIEVTISPVKIKGIGNVASVSKTYDGSASVTLPKTNLAFLDAAGSTISLPESAYTITDARFTTRQDDSIYEDSPNAGTKEAISFTLTLTDSNYVFEGEAANARSANFNFTTNDDRFQINQATVTPAEITLFVYNDMAKTYTLNLATRLPELTQGCEYGEIQYQECTYNFTDRTYLDSKNGISVSNEGVLTLPIVAAHSAVANKQIGTITAPVVTANYQQFELTIKVVIGEKIMPVQSDDFKISATGITYRQTLENSTLTVKGTMKDPTTQEEVKGTFAWKNKYDLPINTGDVYFDWTFTPDESYGGIYAAVTDIVKVPVAPKSIEGATITLEKDEFAYNAAEQSPKITGVTLENWDETRITYVIKSGDKATDVSDRITLTIEGTGNYTGRATVEWKITPKTVKPTIEVASCTYTGDALEPTVTVKDDIGNIIDQKEYEIFYSNNTNAGTATVTIKDVDGGNYVLSEASKTFEITKAAAPTAAAGSLTITNGLHKTYSLDLSTLLPKLTAPCDYGTITYDKKVDTTLGVGTFVTLVNGKTGELTLEANRSATDEGQFGTITVTISTSNYQDITLTVNVSAVNQIRPMPDGEITATPITYGDILSKSEISGKMKDPDTGDAVNGTFTWMDGTVKPDAGSNNATWTFTPDASYGGKYTTNTGTATVTVNCKTVMVSGITASDKVYDGTTNAKLNFSNAKFAGILENDTLTVTAKGVFEKADIGKQKVKISNFKLGGDSAANYVLAKSGNQSETTATITAKEVTVTITPNGGTYGSVAAAAANLSGAVDGENVPVTLTYTGNGYNDTAVPVNAGSYTVTASIANRNYTLTGNTTAAFVIAPKAVTVSGITANDKVYDGTTDAKLDCSNAQFEGILKNDTLTVTATGTLESAGVGERKVRISDLTLGGASAANYVLAESGNQTETTANITAKQITVTITPNGGTYGETITPATVTANGVVGEDAPAITLTYTGTANDGTKYTGTTPPTKAGTYTITATITNPNYKLDAGTATAEFTVTKRSATVTPDNQSKVYEEKDPELTYKGSGVLDGEMLKGITLARAKGENAGKYAITATADASANPNYDVTFAESMFTIEPKSIKGATAVLGKGLAANGAEQTQTVEKVLLGDKEIPADSYTVSDNTATAHGIYTLTVTGKGNYTDSITWTYVIAPSKAEDAPGEDITIGSGKVKVDVKSEGIVPPATLLTNKAELLAMLVDSGDITADELVQIANGASVDIVLTVKEANAPDEVKTAMAQAAKDYTIGQYLDISLFKYMTVNGSQQAGVALHTTKDALTISVVVPDALINTNSAVNRTYCIVRNHEGTITVLDAAFDAANKTLTFKTDRFSVYAIAYKDTAVPSSGSNPGNNSSNDSETKKNEVAAPTPAPTPASTSKPSTITAMPQTGDTSNPTLYVVLLVVSLLGLAVVFVCKRRNNK
jgi:LPXTG-motif cell wall-anchored protein